MEKKKPFSDDSFLLGIKRFKVDVVVANTGEMLLARHQEGQLSRNGKALLITRISVSQPLLQTVNITA